MRKNKNFPLTTFGRDSLHGRSGPEDPNPAPGFAPYRGGSGNGYELEKHKGVWLDHLSIIELEDDEISERRAVEDESDRQLLAQIGTVRDATTLIN